MREGAMSALRFQIVCGTGLLCEWNDRFIWHDGIVLAMDDEYFAAIDLRGMCYRVIEISLDEFLPIVHMSGPECITETFTGEFYENIKWFVYPQDTPI